MGGIFTDSPAPDKGVVPSCSAYLCAGMTPQPYKLLRSQRYFIKVLKNNILIVDKSLFFVENVCIKIF
jgi:hypothetical protein